MKRGDSTYVYISKPFLLCSRLKNIRVSKIHPWEVSAPNTVVLTLVSPYLVRQNSKEASHCLSHSCCCSLSLPPPPPLTSRAGHILQVCLHSKSVIGLHRATSMQALESSAGEVTADSITGSSKGTNLLRNLDMHQLPAT